VHQRHGVRLRGLDELLQRRVSAWGDTLGGNDVLRGGAGSDTLVGGQGDDAQDGGDGADTYLYTGNQAAGRFGVRFGVGAPENPTLTIGDVTVASGLPARHSPPASVQVTWEHVISQTTPLFVQADPLDMVREFRENNNSRTLTLTPPAFLDLQLNNLHTTAGALPAIGVTGTITVPLSVDISNLGGIGAAGDLEVQFWRGQPNVGAYLGSVILNVQNSPHLPVSAAFEWLDVAPGFYNVSAYIAPAPNDVNPNNNLVVVQVHVPATRTYMPAIRRR